ncbi:hypothetical protein [Notoacmeibacter sp. MSK16QG-6]|uniref:hypothetical protein n=1 Tax=Notoacmeibacter sp. MSK16QG-6 TaxID=2957982 RepID=UPI00209E0A14|nr:hypothetical protein [Notoacmeibacter sp. MSK16QG-6]MCP1200410.1 hypothetical protein [Notoacmeibacter sp. MSK16QG-6]
MHRLFHAITPLMVLAATPALAHEALAPHSHPHPDSTLLIGGAVVLAVVAGFVVFMKGRGR